MKHIHLALLLIAFPLLGLSQNYIHLGGNQEIWEQVPKPVLDYLDTHLPTVSEVAKETGLPVDFLLCVSGLETGWGRSELAVEANNHFGIKNPYDEGPSYCCMHSDYYPELDALVEEYTCFKQYGFAWESYYDFFNHLQTRGCYLDIEAIQDPGFGDWAKVMTDCGYATDPNYAAKLYRIRDSYFFNLLIPESYR